MATTKKSVPVSKKHKAPVKKSVQKTEIRSLQRSVSETPFFTLRFTLQSLYWTILSVLVIALTSWVVYNSVRIDDIYNQIDSINADNNYTVPHKTVKKSQ